MTSLTYKTVRCPNLPTKLPFNSTCLEKNVKGVVNALINFHFPSVLLFILCCSCSNAKLPAGQILYTPITRTRRAQRHAFLIYGHLCVNIRTKTFSDFSLSYCISFPLPLVGKDLTYISHTKVHRSSHNQPCRLNACPQPEKSCGLAVLDHTTPYICCPASSSDASVEAIGKIQPCWIRGEVAVWAGGESQPLAFIRLASEGQTTRPGSNFTLKHCQFPPHWLLYARHSRRIHMHALAVITFLTVCDPSPPTKYCNL